MKSQYSPPMKERTPDPGADVAETNKADKQDLDIRYGVVSDAQKMDLYLPKAEGRPFPVLMYIHGGGFMMGDKRDHHLTPYLKALDYGIAVASIEYRLSGEAKFPAAVLDCRAALAYLGDHETEYGIDTGRIAAIGGSAGGNLAMMLGMNIPAGQFTGENDGNAKLPAVRVVVDQFGPMNFLTMDTQANANGVSFVEHDREDSPESRYIGAPIQTVEKENVQAANPLTYAGSAMCPVLVQHGTRDRLVPYEQSVEFVTELCQRAPQKEIKFMPIEGADHDDPLFFTEENMKLVLDFIRDHLSTDQEV